MNYKYLSMFLIGCAVLTACASPVATPPTATLAVPVTPTSLIIQTVVPPTAQPATAGAVTPDPAVTSTLPAASNICADPQVTTLLDSLKTAIQTANGELLSTLVSPSSGLDVRYFHYGTVVNYKPEQAKFLFETTFEVDWGAEPGSGEAKVGPFHEVIVPALERFFGQPYTLHCNELKYGGASYPVQFPYDKDFYTLYFAGTEANGNLDWNTWVAGIEYVEGKPYLYALMQFFWEP